MKTSIATMLMVILGTASAASAQNFPVGNVRIILGQVGAENWAERIIPYEKIKERETLQEGNAVCEFDFSLLKEDVDSGESHFFAGITLKVDGQNNATSGEVRATNGGLGILADGYDCELQTKLR